MNSVAVDIIEEDSKIMMAANWKSESERPEFGDPNYRAFCQVMEERRKFAIAFLQTDDESAKQEIKNCVTWCNDKIKEILGL